MRTEIFAILGRWRVLAILLGFYSDFPSNVVWLEKIIAEAFVVLVLDNQMIVNH